MHLIFLHLFNLTSLGVLEVMLFVGVSKVMAGLISGFSTMRFRMLNVLCCVGRVFGNLRFPSEWLSFCRWLLMVGFLLWIISCLGDVLWRTGVVCVVVMRSQWTTYFIIVLLHIHYGFICFRFSAFIGSCQTRWRVYFCADINGLGIILRMFGI